jgi:ribosomal protein L11 methylase PrmA
MRDVPDSPVTIEKARKLSDEEVKNLKKAEVKPAGAPPPPPPPPTPTTLICSGILPVELDDVAAAFATAGLAEVERRRDGDWAALLLRRA